MTDRTIKLMLVVVVVIAAMLGWWDWNVEHNATTLETKHQQEIAHRDSLITHRDSINIVLTAQVGHLDTLRDKLQARYDTLAAAIKDAQVTYIHAREATRYIRAGDALRELCTKSDRLLAGDTLP